MCAIFILKSHTPTTKSLPTSCFLQLGHTQSNVLIIGVVDHPDTDPDSTNHPAAYPIRTLIFDADPDPYFLIKAETLESVPNRIIFHTFCLSSAN